MFRNATSEPSRSQAGGVTPLYPGPSDAASGQANPSAVPPAVPSAGSPAGRSPSTGTAERHHASWLEREWDFPGLAAALWRQRLAVCGVTAAGLLLAALLLAQWPRAYTAEAVILLDPASQPRVEFEELLTGASPDDQRLGSEILVLRAPDLAGEVVTRLGLPRHPDFNPDLPQHLPPYAFWRALPSGWLAAPRRWLGLAAPEPPLAPEARLEKQSTRILSAFADRLTVERIGRSHAVRVAITSHDAGLAADAANALADRYLAGQLQAKHAATAFAGAWLDRRVADLRERVETAERAAEEYRASTGLIDANGLTVNMQQLAELNTQLVKARGETAAARARLAQVQAELRQHGDALSAAEVLSSPLIHRLKEQEVEVLRQRADLNQEFGPKHPRMLSVEAELKDIQGKIAAEVRQIVAGLGNAVAVASAQESALAAALHRAEAEAAEQGKAQVRLNALEREAEASRGLLETFLQRARQASDQQAIQKPDARIIARAIPPEEPSAPRQAAVLGGSGFVSLLLGLGLALLLSLRERGFHTAAALRAQSGLPVLGLVPRVRARRGAHPADAVADTPLAPLSEAVRMVAAGLGNAQVVLVTAATPDEGKSTLALALARTLALQGGQVLLVDADLRRAGLSAWFGYDRMAGLADMLHAPDRWPLPLAADRVGGLQFLPAGSPNARADMAGQDGTALAGLLPQWRERFSHIVLDAAPVLLASDVRGQASLADGTVLAVRSRRTAAALVGEAVTALDQAGGNLLGSVLTQVDARQLDGMGRIYDDVPRYGVRHGLSE